MARTGGEASDTQLVFSFSQAVNWNMPNGSTPFNGVRITDGDNGVASFAAVVIAPDTTLAGFDASHVTHSNDQILVNFAGLTSKVGDRIVLNVSAVPEPAQWTLMLAGGATMAGLSRRQRRPRHGT